MSKCMNQKNAMKNVYKAVNGERLLVLDFYSFIIL